MSCAEHSTVILSRTLHSYLVLNTEQLSCAEHTAQCQVLERCPEMEVQHGVTLATLLTIVWSSTTRVESDFLFLVKTNLEEKSGRKSYPGDLPFRFTKNVNPDYFKRETCVDVLVHWQRFFGAGRKRGGGVQARKARIVLIIPLSLPGKC